MAYIQDIWGCARSRTKAIRDAQLAVNLLHRLGFGIHPDKVQVNPTQSIEVLGTQVNSVKMQFLVPRSKRRSLLRKCFDTIVLHKQHKLTARRYASLIGTLNAVRAAASSALLHIWPLFHLQKSVLSRVKDWDGQFASPLV